ncbi:MAG TPA: restriction endonuclease [Burkholderiaceae bacterium]|nr:restriction endonuclease [Burkholderiaceae bacterium]
MKFKLAENSLFAILIRNHWWISLAIVAVYSLLCFAFLPKAYLIFGLMGVFPFVVTGIIAFKRQWGVPSAANVQAEQARLAGLNWRDFATELETHFKAQGFQVERINSTASSAVDYRLSKNGQTTLVAAKRYKAAIHGVEPLQALLTQKQNHQANQLLYICTTPVTPQAAKFAREHGIQIQLGLPALS